jgi:monomeric isocitrate dehydrogenase
MVNSDKGITNLSCPSISVIVDASCSYDSKHFRTGGIRTENHKIPPLFTVALMQEFIQQLLIL